MWSINRRMIPWTPEPLRKAASQVIRGYPRPEDSLYERGMRRESCGMAFRHRFPTAFRL